YRTCLPAFVFFFYCSLASRSLPSFPTRRSSDLIHIHPHGNTALLGQVIKDRSEVTPTPHLTRRRKMRLLVDGHRQGAGDVDGDDHVPQHHRHCLARVVTAVSQGGKLGHYLTPAVR